MVDHKWNNPDAAIVMHAIESLRRLVMVVGVIVTVSLLLNASRTYLVSTQINKLQKENANLLRKIYTRGYHLESWNYYALSKTEPIKVGFKTSPPTKYKEISGKKQHCWYGINPWPCSKPYPAANGTDYWNRVEDTDGLDYTCADDATSRVTCKKTHLHELLGIPESAFKEKQDVP